MRRNDTISKGGPAGPAGARNDARSRGAPSAGSATPHGRAYMLVLIVVFILASAVTATGFFVAAVPLWVAGLPLIAAIVAGHKRRDLACVAFAAFMLWPAMLCAAGLTGIGFHPLLVWPLALIAVVALAWLASLTGVVLLALIVTAIPVFPASPLLVLADVVPGTGIAGPAVLVLCLAIVNFMPGHGWADLRDRAGAAAMIAAGVVVWNLALAAYPAQTAGHPQGSPAKAGTQTPEAPVWRQMDEPRALTERGRWIALRDMLPPGSQAIFGENVFAADNQAAIAFWCDAARERDLTLWIGVRLDQDGIRRGAVMRFDPQSCAWTQRRPEIVHAAQRGIPGITGTWGHMQPLQAMAQGPDTPTGDAPENLDGDASGRPDRRTSGGPDGNGPAAAWLICYEAFLVPSWLDVLAVVRQAPDNRRVVVLSNDGAFGSLPVAQLRRKVTDAMAGLTGATVLHAETGRTILVNGGSSRRNDKGGSSRRNDKGGHSRRNDYGGSHAAKPAVPPAATAPAGPAAITHTNERRGE